ncbi:hypothetical protein SGLAU_06870 [Streptomyces glaucescens]|uniref:Uncharacterized protein n=1 Tax=Streptomyces glaucescens TaxID=1907 RepID=A0A089YUW4_STRGA|nr:hypothetical protein SGLAU_06870 [Streptomyces glaucescens]
MPTDGRESCRAVAHASRVPLSNTRSLLIAVTYRSSMPHWAGACPVCPPRSISEYGDHRNPVRCPGGWCRHRPVRRPAPGPRAMSGPRPAAAPEGPRARPCARRRPALRFQVGERPRPAVRRQAARGWCARKRPSARPPGPEGAAPRHRPEAPAPRVVCSGAARAAVARPEAAQAPAPGPGRRPRLAVGRKRPRPGRPRGSGPLPGPGSEGGRAPPQAGAPGSSRVLSSGPARQPCARKWLPPGPYVQKRPRPRPRVWEGPRPAAGRSARAPVVCSAVTGAPQPRAHGRLRPGRTPRSAPRPGRVLRSGPRPGPATPRGRSPVPRRSVPGAVRRPGTPVPPRR